MVMVTVSDPLALEQKNWVSAGAPRLEASSRYRFLIWAWPPFNSGAPCSTAQTALAQVAHRFEIFFDLLAAAGEDADRALAVGRRRPAREAQFRAVGRLDGAGDDVLRNGIGGNRHKRHGRDRIGEKC